MRVQTRRFCCLSRLAFTASLSVPARLRCHSVSLHASSLFSHFGTALPSCMPRARSPLPHDRPRPSLATIWMGLHLSVCPKPLPRQHCLPAACRQQMQMLMRLACARSHRACANPIHTRLPQHSRRRASPGPCAPPLPFCTLPHFMSPQLTSSLRLHFVASSSRLHPGCPGCALAALCASCVSSLLLPNFPFMEHH